MSILAEVQFGREVCGDLDAAEKREWLVTNGIGGFASGTVAGTATRRYHGLLIAALQPPAARTVLVSGLDESVRYLNASYSLAANRWASGFISPSGYLQLESFHLEGTKPVWRYALADALLEKRVWMKQGENTTYVQYTLVRSSASIEIDAKILVNFRDFHSTTHAKDWQLKVVPIEDGLRVECFRWRHSIFHEEFQRHVSSRVRNGIAIIFFPWNTTAVSTTPMIASLPAFSTLVLKSVRVSHL